ncbi:MAG TPA: Holliday junction branch migration DNA helicase RuvB [Candidatus Polarisedimenticolia bacterium]|nr:Holliday junction branch migration DNA helicase RuvB [Candidatus Polarisedimenticolia bacterium]
MLDPDPLRDESVADVALRPRTLDEYVGQNRMKDNLRVFIQAARERGEPLDHVLLYGPPGLGKTTIAHILAGAMQTGLRSTSGPALERAGDLAAILTNLEGCGVLFIDEIHRLPVALEEILYQAMEDFRLDVVIGQGPGARTVKIDLPRFTLVGATTRIGLLSSPLRDRFGIVHHLDFYPVEDLVRIVRRSSGLLGMAIEEAGGAAIARRARGTPRVANRLLRRVRDFVQVDAEGTISGEVADRYLERLEVDRFGLDSLDRKILLTIHEKFDGGPVGVQTIAAALGEEAETIEEIYEPYLMQIGFLDRTPRGRRVTRRALEHLNVRPGRGEGRLLFPEG